jgi:hypothetical protein
VALIPYLILAFLRFQARLNISFQQMLRRLQITCSSVETSVGCVGSNRLMRPETRYDALSDLAGQQ